jgi:hypothetical protein
MQSMSLNNSATADDSASLNHLVESVGAANGNASAHRYQSD